MKIMIWVVKGIEKNVEICIMNILHNCKDWVTKIKTYNVIIEKMMIKYSIYIYIIYEEL